MTTKQQIVWLYASATWWAADAVAVRRLLVSLMGAAQTEPTAIPVKSDAPTSLYGGGAASRDDCVRKQAGDSFRWTGSGQITWKVQVDRAGDYEVALCHAAEPGAVGQHLQVSSGNSRVAYTLAMTNGVLGNKSYEMTPIKGRLRLEAGSPVDHAQHPGRAESDGRARFSQSGPDSRRRQGGRRGRPTGGAAGAGQHGVAGQSRLRADVPLDLAEHRQGRNPQAVCAGR